MASSPSSPAGAPGGDQGLSHVAVAAKISSRKLADPGKAGWAPVMTEEDPRKAPREPGMPGEARNSSWSLGEPGRARCARSSAQGLREGPGAAWILVAAKISSKRLSVPARAGCCLATAEAPGEGPSDSGTLVAAKSLSRRLGAHGRSGSTPWSAAALGKGPGKDGTPVLAMSSSRRLVGLGRLRGWICGSS